MINKKLLLFSILLLVNLSFISAETWKYNYLPETSTSSITINESNFDHNLLINLQGTGTDYFHLNSSEYNSLSTFITLVYANNTYKKYSDFNYVSISNAKLEMPKAGTYKFYLDENVLYNSINISNGTLIKTLAQGATAGWLIQTTLDCEIWNTDFGGYWDYPVGKTIGDTLIGGNFSSYCNIYTAIPNLTLIFPSTVSASIDLSAYYNKTQIESNFTNYIRQNSPIQANLTAGINSTDGNMLIYQGTNCIFIGDKSLYDGSC